ncbi:MAG TPA: lipopolysaccharide kinase InaA family protein [Syntrophales bacterium]|nr:lipopolysaccharide kinase InaA family protein [Syntrophales bacterium]
MSINADRIVIEQCPHMVVNRDYVSILEDRGLLDFDRLYHFQDGTAVKQIQDRGVLSMGIRSGDENRIFFLKRHVAVRPGLWDMIGGFCCGKSLSPGRSEFENICDFRKKGIPTVVPVAAGERKIGCGRYESFLLTESFKPYISFEEIIYKHPERLQGPEGTRRKSVLITAIAHLARQMHDAGFNHRDFNATHVLVGPEDAGGNFALALFDLQRMDRKKWLRPKWFIKTMAELSYTMPEPLFNDQDRLLLFQSYKGSARMGMLEQLQLKWIRQKVNRIGKHTDQIKKRRQQEAVISDKNKT